MVEYALSHHGKRDGLHFARDDGAILSTIGDASVDAVMSVSAAHWVHDQQGLWAACARVLKPGGILDVSSYPYNASEYEPLRRVARTAKWAPTFESFASECFSLDAPLAHVPSAPALRTMLEGLGFDVSECEVTEHHYKIADTGEYAKMLVPWHPWVSHVPAGAQRDEFVAEMEFEYRRFVGMEGARKGEPLPFVFGTLQVRATKRHLPTSQAWSLPASEPTADLAAERPPDPDTKHGVFSMVSPSCSLTHFDETDVDYAQPEISKHMVTVSVPLREFGHGEVDFHTHGFTLLRLTDEDRGLLGTARAIAIKPKAARSTSEERYMENNFSSDGVKGRGAAAIFERIVAAWSEQVYDTPCVAVASASVKMRDSGAPAATSPPHARTAARGDDEKLRADAAATDSVIEPQPHVHVDYVD